MFDLESLKKYGGFLTKGLVAQFAPSMLKGALVEKLKAVTIPEASSWIEKNEHLWDLMGPEEKKVLKYLADTTDMSWLTPAWFIGAIKADCPALASLFLGWTKAQNWLNRQFIEIASKLAREKLNKIPMKGGKSNENSTYHQ